MNRSIRFRDNLFSYCSLNKIFNEIASSIALLYKILQVTAFEFKFEKAAQIA